MPNFDFDFGFDEDEDFMNMLGAQAEELYLVRNILPDAEGLIEAPVLPLRDIIVFPHMVSPLFIGREQSLWAILESQLLNQTVIALTQKNPEEQYPGSDDFLPIGVEMAVGDLLELPDGSSSALVQARRRVEIVEFSRSDMYLQVVARPIYKEIVVNNHIEARMRSVLKLFRRCIQISDSWPEELYFQARNIEDPGWLADMITTALALNLSDRKAFLLEVSANRRLKRLLTLLTKEVKILEIENEIRSQTSENVDQTQREFYLREKMKVIQSELGEGELWTSNVSELRKQLTEKNLPEHARERAEKEIGRLSKIPPMSPEVSILRNYLDWLLELPWNEYTEDNLDVANAAEVLNAYHYGLPQAKDRILEYIAVKNLRQAKARQPILCFVGAPGTGKTSLGNSIAEALNRSFIRVSLGGIRDEAEIRGHRRTYIGALPGRILQTLRRGGSANPVFMLDEIDKLGNDFRGDPSSALLETLDPEQNDAFSDHYLEIPFDLSSVMFITTANTTNTIPPALLDRMEVIKFPGYIEEEKLEIARRFLIPRQIEENGLSEEGLRFSDGALKRLVQEYTLEAGVRNLEREIGHVCRKIARAKVEGNDYPTSIRVDSLERFLGPPHFFPLSSEEKDEIGVATAMAWTQSGGRTMPIEVLLVEGKGKLQITGQVGDVMSESAQAALTYLKSRSQQLNIPLEKYENLDIHIHIPEGAVPKEGPSAGITLTAALASAFTKRPIRKEVGLTGEITLRGNVLPVGGVREKIVAAHRAGLKVVIIPKRNMVDLENVPAQAREELKIIPVEHMDEVMNIALAPA
ncbi:MAG: endopeptidase La [Chloroflexota bacterium]|nr:endopeptidase La [Chloroflexota bacterium]